MTISSSLSLPSRCQVKRQQLSFSTLILGLTLTASPVYATNGFLGHCIGTSCGTGGAGVASPTDATNALINPSLIAKVPSQFVLFAGVFHPHRTMDTSKAPLGNNVGRQTSKNENYPEGSAGVTYTYSHKLSFGVSVAGSGGMATKFKKPRTNPAFQINPSFDKEILYRLIHLAPTVSYRPTDCFAFGISLVAGYSDIKTDSAKPSGMMLAQTNGHLKQKSAFGLGGKIGFLWDVNSLLSLGFSYTSPIWFQSFKKYNDIFRSPMNTPMNFTVGSTWHITPQTEFLLDFKRIFYRTVKTLRVTPEKGGFGWRNQLVFMTGLRHKIDNWTLQIGYNHGKSPIISKRAFANALAPAIVEHHITGGVIYRFSPCKEISLSGFYVPNKKLKDPGTGDRFSQFGKGTKMSMYQFGFQLGLKFHY